jgi:hypothetical protein
MVLSVAAPCAVAYDDGDDDALCLIASLTTTSSPLLLRGPGFAARGGQPRLALGESHRNLLHFSCCCDRDSENSVLPVQT